MSSILVAGGLNLPGLMYSLDGGITWHAATYTPTVPGGGAITFFNSICFSPELQLFVAVQQVNFGPDTDQAFISSDGIHWTAVTLPSPQKWQAVCWSPELGRFCTICDNGGIIGATSTDGVNWVPFASAPSDSWQTLVWVGDLGKFLAINSNVGFIHTMTSTDGLNWTGHVGNIGITGRMALCWSPELMLFCAGDFTVKIATSLDGITWAVPVVHAANTSFQSICWSKELATFCAVGLGGANQVYISPDGTNWAPQISPGMPARLWCGVIWNKYLSQFVAVGDQVVPGTGGVIISLDGTNWVLKNGVAQAPAPSVWYVVAASSPKPIPLFINKAYPLSRTGE